MFKRMRLEVPAKYIYLLKIYGDVSYPLKIRRPENLHNSFFYNSIGENMYEEICKYLPDSYFIGLIDLGLDVDNIYDILPGMCEVTIDYDVIPGNYEKLLKVLEEKNIKLIHDLPLDFN